MSWRINLRFLVVFLSLFVSGCGLKTNLVVYDGSAPLPEVAALSYQVSEKKLALTLNIQGGSGSVLYQIDRAEVDPACKCLTQWLRYYESSASQQRLGLRRNVKLRSGVIYAYRLRVVDDLGRKSTWSKVVRTGHHERDKHER